MNIEFQILSTKLMPPVPRQNYVKRESIFRKLQDLDNYKLIVIKGAAGSGKTTVLASFFKEYPRLPVAWISLDEENNTLFSFWYYVLESLRVFLKEEEEIFTLFQTIMHKEDMKYIVIELINLLSKEENITIVFDDFHYIADREVNESIRYFLKHSSPNIRMIILTRDEPNIYTGELLMAGTILEIGDKDLKLSFHEGVQFIQETLGLNIKRELVQKMNGLAEGWIGGLQLLALAKLDRRNDIENIKALNKYVITYLSNEILNDLKEEEKDFLIKTSILSYFTEGICNQFLGKPNEKEILKRLFQKNLFMTVIDEERGIYRYHAIFQQFLQHCFEKLEKEEKEELYLRAAYIYEQLGDFDECVKVLLEAKDYEAALDKIERYGQNRNGWGYLHHIPLSFVVRRKELAFQLIFYYYCNLELERCVDILTVIYEQNSESEYWRVFEFCKALIVEENLYVDVAFITEMDEMNMSDVTKAIIYAELSFLLRFQERVKEAIYMLHKAQMLEQKIKNPYVKIVILSSLSQIKEDLGELNECEKLYGEIFSFIEKHPILRTMLESCYIGVTGIYLKRLQLDLAEQSLEKVSQGESALEKGYLYNVMELQILKGNYPSAVEIIRQLQAFPVYQQYLASLLKYAIELEGEYREQINLFVSMYHQKKIKKRLRMEDKLLYAKILSWKGNIQESLHVIDEVAEITRKNKMRIVLIESLLLKVCILEKNKKGKREQLNLLREAIYYSYENSILSPYKLMEKQLKPLFVCLKKERLQDLNKAEQDFLFQLLGEKQKEEIDPMLSQRELEVLGVLATGVRNKEIGVKLYISISTVKTHIINIYTKLQVSNRVEAVNKALEIGLITQEKN
ncbi:helix-turn-helix transcriptional regulator [Bacillus pseudomycoides]|uniref:Helix-turn-helix transcriptional regulator n=1 Tax=Bacillus pseudomycoides TaxID=64104 RepID=A0AA91VD76_9BACI|nr:MULTISPECIES: LuxR C-terminal-related transcriptional regulator [Bacillus]PEB52640.1 helix-turn-helix transcriptional regulator [Bacillus sp. AFS098217]PED83101.1 helix-turn-helix transcriptional regulator [Bacillus pseudomycoides]PEU18826.1 helix-turn-helix transcriptional regulator [Bacillus sp. AFS014408]PFW63712.1 helix-turn-helix transcriptional regulator [Bacillus sp. AFS075034]